ncbi:MAG: hypothetical protein ACLGI2_04475 [Acidimicrobiia bacterium]
MSSAPQSRPGRYAEFDAGQLADVVEHAYERDEHPDWELVFELTRRTLAGESDQAGEVDVKVSRSA